MNLRQGRGIDLQSFGSVFITLHLEALALALLGLKVGLAHEAGSTSMGVEERSICIQHDATWQRWPFGSRRGEVRKPFLVSSSLPQNIS